MTSVFRLLRRAGRSRQGLWLLAGAATVLLPVAAQAQGGCIHSPECPTAVLGLVGAGGAALYARWRSR